MRLKVFSLIIATCFILLLCGLGYVQIIKGAYYKRRSEQNRIVAIPLKAPRGQIYDRNNKVCVDNRISFDVSVIYKDARDFSQLVTFLSDTLKIDKKKLMSCMKRAKKRPFAPTVLVEDIGKAKAIMLEQRKIDYPGLVISTRPKRDYLFGERASSVTGYLGEINEDELARFKTYGYSIRDLMGRSGLEKKYDNYLRGIQGGMQVEIDSLGRQKRVLHIKEPEGGNPIYLTIDMDLQEYCYEIMGNRRGCIIAMNPNNGEIFAFVSKPGFDPNIFIRKDKAREVKKILDNVNRDYPLLNRGISCTYPPGSVFKVVVAVAALDTGRFTKDMQFGCNGSFALGKSIFHCWKEEGHGNQIIEDAIKNSCNVFFYQLGLKAGVQHISLYAEKFGFGKPTGIDLPGEAGGLVPTSTWKRIAKKEGWYPGDTVNYSIGQGFLLVTPIQVVCMMAAIANGGHLVQPYIVERIGNVKVSNPEIKGMDISKHTQDIMRRGLVKVVNDQRGTGMKAKLPDIVVAGKTGTAQNPRGKAHGWFSGFAPEENPKMCVVVFVEYGGKGGVEASNLARKVFEKSKTLGLL